MRSRSCYGRRWGQRMTIDDREKQRKLDEIEARIARHRKFAAISLTVLVTLAGLALVLMAWDLFNYLTSSKK